MARRRLRFAVPSSEGPCCVWHPPCENRNCSPFGPPVESPLRDGAPVREGRRSVRGWLCMYPKSSVTSFSRFVGWLLALGLYWLVRRAMFVLLLAGAACFHSHKAALARVPLVAARSEEHTSELQSLTNLVCRL